MVWKRVGSPCHGGCGEGQSGVERQSFHAILLLTTGFGAIRLRRAEEFFDEDFPPTIAQNCNALHRPPGNAFHHASAWTSRMPLSARPSAQPGRGRGIMALV